MFVRPVSDSRHCTALSFAVLAPCVGSFRARPLVRVAILLPCVCVVEGRRTLLPQRGAWAVGTDKDTRKDTR